MKIPFVMWTEHIVREFDDLAPMFTGYCALPPEPGDLISKSDIGGPFLIVEVRIDPDVPLVAYSKVVDIE